MAKGDKLTFKQELFCKKYIEYRGNGTKSYCDAFDKDYNNPKDNALARNQASELIAKPNIVVRIRELLDETGLNNLFVDNELKHLIWQDDDRNAKAKGIDIYNKIARRYDEKIEVKIEQKFKANFNLE
tara:strand:- start:371 stop:754 length:384 start_codon:yes stop_codon:yes gene_type:complete